MNIFPEVGAIAPTPPLLFVREDLQVARLVQDILAQVAHLHLHILFDMDTSTLSSLSGADGDAMVATSGTGATQPHMAAVAGGSEEPALAAATGDDVAGTRILHTPG